SRVGTAWQEIFRDLASEPPLEVWQQAWRTWCQPRGVPPAEISACVLERRDYRLRVQVPKRLLDRLRATRSDALKGEAWLLPETGDIRPAALIEIHEGEVSFSAFRITRVPTRASRGGALGQTAQHSAPAAQGAAC